MNREEWLNSIAKLAIDELFIPNELITNGQTGAAITEKLAISCGWPAHLALSRSKRRAAETWFPEVSTGGVTEIFISPFIGESMLAAETLVHELVHVAVGKDAGHGPAFKRAMIKVGLDGNATSTFATSQLTQMLSSFIEQVGPYPHSKIDATNPSKQTTRLLKAYCANSECPSQDKGGYTVRITKMWAVEGLPFCGICNERLVCDDNLEPQPEVTSPDVPDDCEDENPEGEPQQPDEGSEQDEDGEVEVEEKPTPKPRKAKTEPAPRKTTKERIEELRKKGADKVIEAVESVEEVELSDDDEADLDALEAAMLDADPDGGRGPHNVELDCDCPNCVTTRHENGME